MEKTYTIIVKQKGHEDIVRRGVDQLNRCVIVGELNLYFEEAIKQGSVIIEVHEEHYINLNINELKKVVGEDAWIYFYKGNTIWNLLLKDVRGAAVLPVICLKIDKRCYTSRCYIDSITDVYYLQETSDYEKDICSIREKYDYWCFGSCVKEIEIPHELKKLGFTKAVEDHYECDSSD